MSIVRQAEIFATAAHHAIDQRRKYTGAPYIMHPEAVARIVASVPHTEEMLAAAWLHDVIEDTRVTINVIDDIFGGIIGNMVYALTNEPIETGNRAKRMAINIARLARAEYPVKVIKIADLIDNTSTIVEFDPKFAPQYLKEKRMTLEAIKDLPAAYYPLWQRAWDQCEAC